MSRFNEHVNQFFILRFNHLFLFIKTLLYVVTYMRFILIVKN